MRPTREEMLERMLAGLRREAEAFERRERARARREFAGLVVFIAAALGAASVLGILLSR